MPRNFYNLPPSWNPGYAIPKYVMDEPPARGTFTTSWLPRGTISQVPRDLGTSFKPGFVLPPSVKEEEYGQNPFTTQWMPRGTIFGPVPEFGPNPSKELLGRPMTNLGSLGDDTLSAGATTTRDPIGKYGQTAASYMLRRLAIIPSAEQRSKALRAVFDSIDTSLAGKVEVETSRLQRKGMAPAAALQKAIATSMSAGMQKELVDLGRGKRKTKGHVALGSVRGAKAKAQRDAFESLGFGFSDLNPVKYITAGASAAASAVNTAIHATGSGIATGAGAVKDAAVATAGAVKDVVSTLGDLACGVVGSDAYKTATVAATSAFAGPGGGQAAGTGIDIQRGICGGGSKAPAGVINVAPPPAPASPSWLLPAVVGIGIFGVGALLLGRK